MQSYPAIEEEGYHSHPSRSNVYRSDVVPAIMIDYVTEMSSNRYSSSNEGILTPQDSNSMDDPLRGSLSRAAYLEKSEDPLNEYEEVPDSSTMSYHGDMNCFNAGLGTQFETEGGDGSQTTCQVDAAGARDFGIGTPWNGNNVGQYPQRDTELNELWLLLTDIQCRRTSPGLAQVGALLQYYGTTLANFISPGKRTCLAGPNLHAQRIRRIIHTNLMSAARP